MKTILVVDDEVALLELIESILVDSGYRVVTATNGRQALARLDEFSPDLIITDYMMPVVDGPKLIHTLRNLPDFKMLPVIIVSSVAEESVNRHVTDYQAYLRKPFRIAVLLSVVSGLIGDLKEGAS